MEERQKHCQSFLRHEMKYLLSPEQYSFIKEQISLYMSPDEYGPSLIQSLYYDTPSDLLIRRSIEKPKFKEKIRVRSYGVPKEDTPLYLEIKRKSDGWVYKRRVRLSAKDIDAFFQNSIVLDGQIGREITCFRDSYKNLSPKMLITYIRSAFCSRDLEPFRLTFDKDIRYRKDNLLLVSSERGKEIISPDETLMELKVFTSIPLWFTRILTQGKIYQTAFSKYGKAYMDSAEINQTERRLRLWTVSSARSLEVR